MDAHLQAILTRPLQWKLIKTRYDAVIKLATALRLGTADSKSILRRFTRQNVQHPAYRARAELGNAVKAAFLWDDLRQQSVRREMHGSLQVIESWNSASGFILYGKGGELTSHRVNDQRSRLLVLHLLQVSLMDGPENAAWPGRVTAAAVSGS
ncbi:Tn3 family transposase [Deinococcus rufus]|uniref:Tn3 family transposase n=1 Tax=Deinococcus rufus TaxID=2136097 RepID=A0ABV7ZDG6_9DEIO